MRAARLAIVALLSAAPPALAGDRPGGIPLGPSRATPVAAPGAIAPHAARPGAVAGRPAAQPPNAQPVIARAPAPRPAAPAQIGRVRAEIVLDAATGRVLHEANADAPARPASLAKLMTLERLFAALDAGLLTWESPIRISPRAASRPATRLGLPPGATITAREAALCLAVHSCNDIATAVAEHLGGSEAAFAQAMTEAAWGMDLRATRFANASGLPDPGNVSTARDLARLGGALMARHPRHWPLLGVERWRHGEAAFRNTARLIGRNPLIEGGKTGFVQESGFNMFAAASAPDGRRVIVVVLGGATAAERDARIAALAEAGLAAIGPGPLRVSANQPGPPAGP
jgi:D-alanyl-D-alanine carboxypeptidase